MTYDDGIMICKRSAGWFARERAGKRNTVRVVPESEMDALMACRYIHIINADRPTSTADRAISDIADITAELLASEHVAVGLGFRVVVIAW